MSAKAQQRLFIFDEMLPILGNIETILILQLFVIIGIK